VAAAAAIPASTQRRPRLRQKLTNDILTLLSKGHLNLVATLGLGIDWMDLEDTAAIFAAAAKKAHSVAAIAESIQSVDVGSGVGLGSRRDRAPRASRIEIKIDRIA
jgi:hypothetical protein